MTRPISGVDVAYYFVCKRKLWLFSHGIAMEHESDAVKIGKLIDDSTFERERKNQMIDGIINIDFLHGDRVIHEIKTSDSLAEAHQWQVKYYLYYLKQKGTPLKKGVIHYPKTRRTEDVTLSAADEVRFKNIILPEIRTIMELKNPVKLEKLPYCKKCSYFGFCYV